MPIGAILPRIAYTAGRTAVKHYIRRYAVPGAIYGYVRSNQMSDRPVKRRRVVSTRRRYANNTSRQFTGRTRRAPVRRTRRPVVRGRTSRVIKGRNGVPARQPTRVKLEGGRMPSVAERAVIYQYPEEVYSVQKTYSDIDKDKKKNTMIIGMSMLHVPAMAGSVNYENSFTHTLPLQQVPYYYTPKGILWDMVNATEHGVPVRFKDVTSSEKLNQLPRATGSNDPIITNRHTGPALDLGPLNTNRVYVNKSVIRMKFRNNLSSLKFHVDLWKLKPGAGYYANPWNLFQTDPQSYQNPQYFKSSFSRVITFSATASRTYQIAGDGAAENGAQHENIEMTLSGDNHEKTLTLNFPIGQIVATRNRLDAYRPCDWAHSGIWQVGDQFLTIRSDRYSTENAITADVPRRASDNRKNALAYVTVEIDTYLRKLPSTAIYPNFAGNNHYVKHAAYFERNHEMVAKAKQGTVHPGVKHATSTAAEEIAFNQPLNTQPINVTSEETGTGAPEELTNQTNAERQKRFQMTEDDYTNNQVFTAVGGTHMPESQMQTLVQGHTEPQTPSLAQKALDANF